VAAATDVRDEDPTFVQRLFKRKTGVTPARDRQRFQGIGAVERDPTGYPYT
jgi:hypothetical protein